MIIDQHELKRRFLLRLKGIASGQALIGPATVQIHLTDLCNLACKYCYYYGPDSAHQPTGKNQMPYEVIERVAQDCAQLKVDTINLSGQGDPSLHPRFYDILRLLEGSFAISINSNGTFPIARCRDILRANRIVINLGEADRESYQALQGRDLFVKVIKNIRELARLKGQFNPDFRIEVVFIATRLNIESQLRTENLVKKLGATVVRKTIAESAEHSRHIMLSEDAPIEDSTREWPPCYHGWFYSAIQLTGHVNICCFMQRLTMGNVFTTSFKEIWESEAYARARNSALTGDPLKNFHECVNCRVAWRNKEIGAQMDKYYQMQKA